MGIPFYPWTLPSPQLQQQIKNKERTVRTQMASGSSRARTLGTAKESLHQLTFVFDQSQYDAFIGWFEYRLKSIDTWFLCDILREGGTKQETIRFNTEINESKTDGGLWVITAPVEIKRATRFDEDAAILKIFSGNKLLQWQENLTQFFDVYKGL